MRPAGLRRLGILAHSVEGATLCLRTFCQLGAQQFGPHQHPDVTLDCIAFGRSMPAWDAQDFAAVRITLATSVARLADAGADFFASPRPRVSEIRGWRRGCRVDAEAGVVCAGWLARDRLVGQHQCC